MPKPKLVVSAGEDPWTAAEVAEVKAELESDVERLARELGQAAKDLQELMADNADGAGADNADIGSMSIERDSELSLAENQRELLEQTQKALERLDDGTYGTCESCGEPIGKLRLMAFPRATQCMDCKRLEERR